MSDITKAKKLEEFKKLNSEKRRIVASKFASQFIPIHDTKFELLRRVLASKNKTTFISSVDFIGLLHKSHRTLMGDVIEPLLNETNHLKLHSNSIPWLVEKSNFDDTGISYISYEIDVPEECFITTIYIDSINQTRRTILLNKNALIRVLTNLPKPRRVDAITKQQTLLFDIFTSVL